MKGSRRMLYPVKVSLLDYEAELSPLVLSLGAPPPAPGAPPPAAPETPPPVDIELQNIDEENERSNRAEALPKNTEEDEPSGGKNARRRIRFRYRSNDAINEY